MKKNCKLLITSINKKTLFLYTEFILIILKKNNINYNFFSLPIKRKKVCLLKSPHVNKIAKENFQIKFFKNSFIFNINLISKKEIKWLFLNKPRCLHLSLKL